MFSKAFIVGYFVIGFSWELEARSSGQFSRYYEQKKMRGKNLCNLCSGCSIILDRPEIFVNLIFMSKKKKSENQMIYAIGAKCYVDFIDK